MTTNSFVIQPDEAEALIKQEAPLVIDLSNTQNYAQQHIPSAVNLAYEHLIDGQAPAPGNLPSIERLQALHQALGIDPQAPVLVYDDEGNGRACRFIWTLDCVGVHNYRLIDGGMHSWVNEGHPTEQTVNHPHASQAIELKVDPTPIADKAAVLAAIEEPNTVILDVRTPEEYHGQRGGSRFGHIPSAVHLNWLDTLDQNRNLRFLPDKQLLDKYAQIGVTPDKKIIAHCQTNHRSAHTYALLKHLEFKDVKAYGGSWAEWSADLSLPIE